MFSDNFPKLIVCGTVLTANIIKKVNTHILKEGWSAVAVNTHDTHAQSASGTCRWAGACRSCDATQSADGRHASCCKISCSLFIVVMDCGLYHTNRPTTRALLCLSLVLSILYFSGRKKPFLYGILLIYSFFSLHKT